jgi:beta-N-acetylhexosaminidase
MTKQSLLLICGLGVVALLLGYNYFKKPFADLTQNLAASQLTTGDEIEVENPISPAEEVVATMTARQKITQLLAVPLTVNESFKDSLVASQSAQMQWIQQNNPGSVVLFGTNVSTAAASVAVDLAHQPTLSAEATSSAMLKPLVAVDHEGGTVQRLRGPGFSQLKSWAELCRMDQVSTQIALEQSAEELNSVGIDVVLAPVIDVGTNNRALGSRMCSGDFGLVNERARLATNAYLNQDILPVYKHFPGIGKTTKDLHTAFDKVTVSEEEANLYRVLLELYAARPVGVMVSHVGVENQDPNVPCSMSPSCVSQLTSNVDNVLVFSDDVLMAAAYQGLDEEKQTLYNVVLQAIVAGNHQVIIGPGADPQALNDVVLLIEEAYNKNNFVKQMVDQSATKVVEYKINKSL